MMRDPSAEPVLETVEESTTGQPDRVTIRSQQYDRDNIRPNVHIGMHYAAVVAEYG